MTPGKPDDLEALFGPLVEDIGLVTIDLGQDTVLEIDATNWAEARAAVLNHRPKLLPKITADRPRHYWAEHFPPGWRVIEYGPLGERQVALFKSAFAARQYLTRLRRRKTK